MANSVINLGASPNGYIGQPIQSAAQGQIYNNGTPGPLGSALSAIGTSTMDGASTTITVNFIDGVQKLSQYPVILNLQSVTAGATINGVANQSIYSGVGSFGQLRVGQSVVVAGFATAANNGTFTVTAVFTSSVQVTNAGPSVAETNFSATLTATLGQRVSAVSASRSALNFAGTADTANAVAAVATVTAISNTGCTLNLSAAGNAGTASYLIDIYFAS
jgi:hypothetical protein